MDSRRRARVAWWTWGLAIGALAVVDQFDWPKVDYALSNAIGAFFEGGYLIVAAALGAWAGSPTKVLQPAWAVAIFWGIAGQRPAEIPAMLVSVALVVVTVSAFRSSFESIANR